MFKNQIGFIRISHILKHSTLKKINNNLLSNNASVIANKVIFKRVMNMKNVSIYVIFQKQMKQTLE